MSQALDVMEPNAADTASVPPGVADALADDDLRFKVWGGDWCGDCTGQLPTFAAALDAAGVPQERIDQHPVEKVDGEKQGPYMDEYDVEYIPTVVVLRDGEEVARFVESEDDPIAEHLAAELGEATA